jgi:pimeloyl-ACP methyl ester carboxylesterase
MPKSSISERMYLQFLRTKFKTIGKLSPSVAGKLAFNLFCTPYPKYKKTKAPAIFHQATKLAVQVTGGLTIKGYEWKSNKSNGKTVLICHGYASHFYKFDQYIQPLLKNGFRVLGFDAPAHGQSEGKYINAAVYKDAVEHIIKVCGPIDHFMGHSLGGLTLALVAESMPNQEAHKFVLIAPATKTTTTLESYFNMMRLTKAVREGFFANLSKLTPLPITYFEADRALENYKGQVFWVHDQGDRVCPIKDLEKFKATAPENIKFLITNGLGHNKVYKTPEIVDQIVAFLSA